MVFICQGRLNLILILPNEHIKFAASRTHTKNVSGAIWCHGGSHFNSLRTYAGLYCNSKYRMKHCVFENLEICYSYLQLPFNNRLGKLKSNQFNEWKIKIEKMDVNILHPKIRLHISFFQENCQDICNKIQNIIHNQDPQPL